MPIIHTLARIALATLLTAMAVPAPASEYAGQEARDIKALPASEVEGLLAGAGMGFAKAAELNGYPGPAHVLELASQLGLSDAQLARTRAIHARMQARAVAEGASLVDAERELERLFRSGGATPQRLSEMLTRAARAEAKVREAHLVAHIEQTRLLSAEQVAKYNHLRSYAPGQDEPVEHRRHPQGADGHGH